MNALARSSAFLLLLIIPLAPFQSSAQDQKATGSIAGRITISDKPAAGISVVLLQAEPSPSNQPPIARARTDEQGYYRLTGVPEGRYIVSPLAPAYVVPLEYNAFRAGKSVTLQDGEAIESVNVQLIRGGVITGRVTDAEGRPMVGVRVQIEDRDRKRPVYFTTSLMLQTDDRGIYRVYGLAEGRYTVSVGETPGRISVPINRGDQYHVRTFHPDVTDESNAGVIEVTPGSEATGVDIKVGRTAKYFTASGRVIDTLTGKPVAGAVCGFGPLSEDGKQTQGSRMGFRTDSAGNFKLEGLWPGRFAAFAMHSADNETYSEPVIFQVNSEDVRGLEIKLVSGGSISGVVVIEGTDDPAVIERVSQLSLYPSRISQGEMDAISAPRQSPRIEPDGSFRIGGLPEGKFRINLLSYPVQKGFALLRVERDGLDQRGGIEVAAGEHISGVRVIIGYGSSVVRGQIRVEGEAPPEGTRFTLYIARRADGAPPSIVRPVQADERGRFVFDGLMAGDYEIHVSPWRPASGDGQGALRSRPVKQAVTVGNQSEIEVTIVVNLSEQN
jgi:protocatechuate 3,4-dioxygenase beta subunit